MFCVENTVTDRFGLGAYGRCGVLGMYLTRGEMAGHCGGKYQVIAVTQPQVTRAYGTSYSVELPLALADFD